GVSQDEVGVLNQGSARAWRMPRRAGSIRSSVTSVDAYGAHTTGNAPPRPTTGSMAHASRYAAAIIRCASVACASSTQLIVSVIVAAPMLHGLLTSAGVSPAHLAVIPVTSRPLARAICDCVFEGSASREHATAAFVGPAARI